MLDWRLAVKSTRLNATPREWWHRCSSPQACAQSQLSARDSLQKPMVSMKLGNGSSSLNEDISRHKPFTQLCLQILNEFGDALTMPRLHRAPYSNTSDQNYQAMLTTEPIDTANHRRRSCRLIHSLRPPDEQRHRRGTMLTWAAPVGGHGTIRTPRVPSTKDGPSSNIRREWSHR